MNLGTARIVIVAALVVGGIAVLANGFGSAAVVTPPSGGSSQAGGSPSGSPSPHTPKPPRATPSPQVHGVLIAVFNGTNAIGLAGQVEQTLVNDGYKAAQDAADAPSKPVAKTVVYFRGGQDAAQNRSDATYVADHYLNGAAVKLLGSDQASSVAATAQVVIILGVDFASANGG